MKFLRTILDLKIPQIVILLSIVHLSTDHITWNVATNRIVQITNKGRLEQARQKVIERYKNVKAEDIAKTP